MGVCCDLKMAGKEKIRGFNACAYAFRCHTIPDDFNMA
jgi:hypothetical protein